MHNLPRISEEDLLLRAKSLYFDRNEEIQQIFVNEFGQFAYRAENLTETSKQYGAKVFMLTRTMCANIEGEAPVIGDAEMVAKLETRGRKPQKK